MTSKKNRSGIAGMFGGMATTVLALVALVAMAAGAGASFRQNDDAPTPVQTDEASTTADGVTPEVTKGPAGVPPTPVRIVAEDDEAETGGATSTGPFVLVGDSIFDVTSVCLTNALEGAQNMVLEGLRLDAATVRVTLTFDGGFRGAELVINERGPDGTTMMTAMEISPDSFSLADGRGSGLSDGEPVAFDTTGASISQCASAPAAGTDTAAPEPETDLPDSDETTPDAGSDGGDTATDTDTTNGDMTDGDMTGDDMDVDVDTNDGDMTDDAATDGSADGSATGNPSDLESDGSATSGKPAVTDEPATGDTAESAPSSDTEETAESAPSSDAEETATGVSQPTRQAADSAWLTVLGSEPFPLTATCLDLTPAGTYALRASVAVAGSAIDSISLEPTTGGMILVVRNANGVVTHISGPNATQVINGDGLAEVAAIGQSMENAGVNVPLQAMMTNTQLFPCGDLGLEYGASSDASGIGSAFVKTGEAATPTFMTVIGACRAIFAGGDALAVRLTAFDDSEESTAFGYGRSLNIRDATLIVGSRTFGHASTEPLTEITSPGGLLVLNGGLVDTAVAAADREAGDQVMLSIAINEDQIGLCPTPEG